MKKKTLVLLLAVAMVMMATGCATIDWLLEDTSTPTTVVEPAPVAEQPKPAPVPAPKPMVEPKPPKPTTPLLALSANQTLVGSAAMSKAGNGIYLAQTADSVIVAFQGEDGYIRLARPDTKGSWTTQKIPGIPVAVLTGLVARDAMVVVGYSISGQAFSATSTDAGITFANPVAIIPSRQNAAIQDMAIDADGTIHIVFHRHDSYWDYNYARSLDKGKTYQTFLDFTKLTDSNSTGYSSNLSAVHGNLYTVYQDNNDQFAAKLSVSKDNGTTWKTSRIGPSSGGRLGLAVDPKDPNLAYVAAFTKDGLTILRVKQATTDNPEYLPVYGDGTLTPGADAFVSVHMAIAEDRTIAVAYLDPATGSYNLLTSKDLGETWENEILSPPIQPKNFIWSADLESFDNAFYFARSDGQGNILLHGPDSRGQAGSTTPVVQPAQKAAPAPQKTYKVGEKGPAGGFIVYDKGSTTDGWRYLELAPEESEFDYIEWGGGGTLVDELQKGIGTGLENTKRIVSVFGAKEPRRGNNYPAKMCDDLVYNGYSDWFLPSHDELILMHSAIIAKGLGTPSEINQSYWSSTEQGHALAWYLITANGTTSDANRDFKNKTRAMRRF